MERKEYINYESGHWILEDESSNDFVNESFDVRKEYQTINKEIKHSIECVPASSIGKQGGLLKKELRRKTSEVTLNAKIRLNHILLKMKSLSKQNDLWKTNNTHIGTWFMTGICMMWANSSRVGAKRKSWNMKQCSVGLENWAIVRINPRSTLVNKTPNRFP